MERLCADGENAEAESLMPHLLYLWERGQEGLRLAEQELATLLPDEQTEQPSIAPEDALRSLPELLTALRRPPSQDCLDALLAADSTDEGQALLRSAKDAVSAISFDGARRWLEEYRALVERRPP